jgi:hypothetical protein
MAMHPSMTLYQDQKEYCDSDALVTGYFPNRRRIDIDLYCSSAIDNRVATPTAERSFCTRATEAP